jgi:Uma2 family endonuclease
MSVVKDFAKYYTYADYEGWDNGVRCELIDGIVYMMSSPVSRHQRIVGKIFKALSIALDGKKCEPFMAPLDVRLFPEEDKSDDTVVQPDVFVVCDESKIDDDGWCRGAPDVIFEVLSGFTAIIDINSKRRVYERAGVKEYWVIDRDSAIQWLLVDGKYEEHRFTRDGNGNFVIFIQILSISIML